MVAKPTNLDRYFEKSIILAKIHMVAKRAYGTDHQGLSIILAKIHMVAKQPTQFHLIVRSIILAKIHMVAKLIL